MLRLVAVAIGLIALLIGDAWAEKGNGQSFKLKLENEFVQFAVWSSGKVERYVAVPHSRDQTVRYPAVAPEGIDAVRACLSEEGFSDLPTSCGMKPNYTGNVFVLDYEGDVDKHRVEVVNLKDQPPNDEVARFQRIWKTAFAICVPSVKIEDYEKSITTSLFLKPQVWDKVGFLRL